MISHNKVTMTGSIVSDVELRYSNQGIPVLNFRIVNFQKKSRTPTFIDVEFWGEKAQDLDGLVQKGSKVFIDGEIRQDNWISKNGEQRSKIKITADQVFLT